MIFLQKKYLIVKSSDVYLGVNFISNVSSSLNK